jgi:hypothetical protein
LSLVDGFITLRPECRARVLAQVIHYETINARAVHLDRPGDADGLYKITERIHRLASAVQHALRGSADKERWAIELVIASKAAPERQLQDWIDGAQRDG